MTSKHYFPDKPFKFDPLQIENIIDKVVPVIAAPEDHEFFRGVLFCKADSCRSSAEFSIFIASLLKAHAGEVSNV